MPPEFWTKFFNSKIKVYAGAGLLVALLILNIYLLYKYFGAEGFTDMKLPFRTMAGYYP